MMKNVYLSLLMIIGFGSVFAQPGWNWPEDSATAVEKNALYTDYLRGEKYQDALPPLSWLLENAPDLNESIYINGIKIYSNLEELESDATKKKELRTKVLDLHDKRIEYFGNEIDVLNRKAYTAYKYFKSDKSKYKDLFDIYEITYQKSGKDVHTNNLVAYMDVIRRYKLTGGNLSDSDILDRYDKINWVIDEKVKSGDDPSKYEKHKELIDKLLTSVVTVDCDFIQNNLGPKIKEDPSNINMAKKIISLSLASKCSDQQIFLDAAKIVQKHEPTFGMAKLIAIKEINQNHFDVALKYYDQAVQNAKSNSDKAEIYYDLAAQYMKRGMKPQARTNALKAAQADASFTKAYKLIGDLYLDSFNECRKNENPVEDRAVYIAAYEMYKRAGDNKMIQITLEQFPTIEDIFTYNLEEGKTIQVGCWINESVTIQRRPS